MMPTTCLWQKGQDPVWFYGKRIDNPNTHGTGCTLSSAIASNLAKGYDLTTAVKYAKNYISGALAAGVGSWKGKRPDESRICNQRRIHRMNEKIEHSVFQNGLIWFGAGVSIAEILTGTYFAPLGFGKAMAAILLGHFIGGTDDVCCWDDWCKRTT